MPISILFLFFFYLFSVVAIDKNTKSSENTPSIDDRVDPLRLKMVGREIRVYKFPLEKFLRNTRS